MKLCVPVPWFFDTESTEGFCNAVRSVKELGFDTIETYQWKHLDLKKVKEALDETGVKLLSMCVTEFRLTTPEHRQLWLDGLKETCEACEFLGVKRLITQVGHDSGAAREAQHAAIVETLIQGVPTMKASDIIVMPEPLNVLVDHPGYYLISANEGFDIIREVNSPNVKLIYDMYHQQVSESNIIPSVVNNLDLIEHLHAAGHPGRNEMWNGETDYKNVFAAIDKAGYTGYCGVEYAPLMDPIESLKKVKEIYGN